MFGKLLWLIVNVGLPLEELKVSDEDQKKQDEIYAKENADLAEIDVQRSVINPPKKV